MEDQLMFDGMRFQGRELPPAELPGAWRLLRTGSNPLTKEGKPFELKISKTDVENIVQYAAEKGEKIPIDSRHTLFALAEKHGIEETALEKAVPQKCAALGYASLEAREDGVWAVDAEWTPLGAAMIRNGCFRYFSPVIRGMSPGGVLRISSIALDNVPALNNLDVIAAADHIESTGKDSDMSNLEEALQILLGNEAVALSDTQQTMDAAEKILALAAELPLLREQASRVQALEEAAENAERDKVISRGLAAGKFCNAQRPVLETLPLADLIALEAVGKAGSAVPIAIAPLNQETEDEREEETLSPEEKAVARSLNLTEKEFRKAKKQTQNKEI